MKQDVFSFKGMHRIYDIYFRLQNVLFSERILCWDPPKYLTSKFDDIKNRKRNLLLVVVFFIKIQTYFYRVTKVTFSNSVASVKKFLYK